MGDIITLLLALPFLILLLKALNENQNKKCGEKSAISSTWETLPKISILRFLLALRDLSTAMGKLTRLFGETSRIFTMQIFTEKIVVLNDPTYQQQLLSSKDLGHLTKPKVFYRSLLDMLGNGVLTSNGEYWHAQRRLLSKGFTYSALKRYTKVYNKCAKRLVADLENLFSTENGMEYQQINSLLHVSSIQIITETVMGLDMFKDKTEAELIADSFNSLRLIALQRVRLGLLGFWQPIWKLLPISWEHDKKLKIVNDVINKMIDRYKTFHGKTERYFPKPNLKSSDDNASEEEIPFENMMELMYKSGMNDDQILEEVKTLIWAGYETTSAAMHYLLFMMAVHKHHQEACRKEIDNILSDSNYCQNGEFSMEGLSEMKHLEHCLLETLRMFPVVSTLLRKLDSPLKVDDSLEIPEGSTALIPIGFSHKLPEYFPDPEKFEPDRFLAGNNVKPHSVAFNPFSSGPRICIGLKFAVMEAKTIVAHILKEFELHTSDNLGEVPILPSLVSSPQRDYYFFLKKRNDCVPNGCQIKQ